MGDGHIQLGLCPEIGFEFVQRRAGNNRLGPGRIAVQFALSATGRLAKTVRLLDDAEQQRGPAQHQFFSDDSRS